MVVTRSYQILLPKNHFLPFSHWYLHCNKKVPTWEGKVVERKQKQFWNQWSSGNNLAACPIGNSEIFSIRITLIHHPTQRYLFPTQPSTYSTAVLLPLFILILSHFLWYCIIISLILFWDELGHTGFYSDNVRPTIFSISYNHCFSSNIFNNMDPLHF